MAFSLEQIDDFITTTQKNYKKHKFEDLASDLQRYHMMRILKDKKHQDDGGTYLAWLAMMTDTGAARNAGPYSEDIVVAGDVMKDFQVPWRRTETSYAFDQMEFKANMSPSQITNLVQTKRKDAFLSLWKKMEANWWGAVPAVADVITPYGLFYYMTRKVSGLSAAASTGEFCAANPGSHTTCAGQSASTYPNWSNWTHQYVDATEDDLLEKMLKAATFTDFESPIDPPSVSGADDYVMYCAYETRAALTRLARNRNDNLGKDLAAYEGKVTFNGNPIRWVPYFESGSHLTQLPVLGVNWGAIFPVTQTGMYMNETKPEKAPNQHLVRQVHVDTMWNSKCVNRRKLWYLSK
jgi:hypothetical protein